MSFRYGVSFALILLCVGTPSRSQTTSPVCDDLSRGSQACLPWGYIDLSSELGSHVITDLSKDGSVVAGSDTSVTEVFQWNLVDGKRVLSMPGTEWINTFRPIISENGSFLVAVSQAPNNDRVFRWDVNADTTLTLPIGTSNWFSNVYPGRPNGGLLIPSGTAGGATISADGNTITGTGTACDANEDCEGNFWTFQWTPGGGTSDPPQQEFTSRVFSFPIVSGNASRIVGSLESTTSTERQAASWKPGVGITLAPNDTSFATAVSFDGEVVAGYRDDAGANPRGWSWTQSSGLQDLANDFTPRAVSDDGEEVTGHRTSTGHARIWTSSGGLELLTSYLSGFGVLFGLNPVASAIVSGDGHVFTARGTQWVAKVSPLRAVGLGDSYSSGEGAPGDGYDSGTALLNRCHRSHAAYSALIKPNTSTQTIRAIAQQPWAPDFSWDLIACSGATTENITRGGADLKLEDPQLDQNVVDADTDLITITIGGNDAYFVPILLDCIFKDDCRDASADDDPMGRTWAQYAPTLVVEVGARVKLLLDEIRAEANHEATVILLGYPDLLAGQDCAEAEYRVLGIVPTPWKISAAEQNWIRGLSRLLNDELAKAAQAAGVHFLRVAERFGNSNEDHNVCGSDEDWINGVDLYPFKSHSFHPNEIGHELGYAEVVNEFLRETSALDYPHGFFASGMPKNPPPTP